MRDFLAAVRDRIVVFDGGMGATLEQFDLSLENDYKLPGRCHEALVLNRPDVIQGVHESMIEAGAEVVETDTFQASRLKLDEWGLGEHTPRSTARPRRSRAPRSARSASSRARSARRASCPPRRTRRSARSPSATSSASSRSRRRACVEGGVDLLIVETAQDILEVKAAIFGVREAFKATGRAGPHPGLRLAAAQGRQDAARHRHLLGAGHARGAARRRHRAQLLDRPRGHARRDPLPRRVLAGADPLHPQRRHPAAGPRRRDDLPRAARAAGRDARRVRRALRREHRRRLLRHHARPHPRDRGALHRLRVQRAPRPAPAARVLDDRRDAAGPGPRPDARRRARQLPGLAQGQGDAAGRRLRRAARRRRGPGRGRRARARPLRRAHRAPGRGRADAPRGQEGLAVAARAGPDRLDRARGHREGARPGPRPRDRQLDQPRGRPRQARPRDADRARARRGAHRPHHRRGGHGQDARPQGRDRPPHPRDGLRRPRAGPRAADLRRADLHADDRRRRVEALRGRDHRGHQGDQERAARRADLARRLQRLLRRLAAARARPELGVPAPLRGGGARPRDGQPQPHHAVRRDLRGGAGARRRPRVQHPRGRARALHRALRDPRGVQPRTPPPTRPPTWSPRTRCTGTSCAARRRAWRTRSTSRWRRSARSRRSTTSCCPP